MLAEHRFISTADQSEALLRATEILERMGFTVYRPEHTKLDASRGARRAGKAKRFSDLPHRVLVEFDRGSIEAASLVTPRTKNKRRALQRSMSLAPLKALDSALSGVDPESATSEWEALTEPMQTRALGMTALRLVLLIILVPLVAILLTAAVIAIFDIGG